MGEFLLCARPGGPYWDVSCCLQQCFLNVKESTGHMWTPHGGLRLVLETSTAPFPRMAYEEPSVRFCGQANWLVSICPRYRAPDFLASSPLLFLSAWVWNWTALPSWVCGLYFLGGWPLVFFRLPLLPFIQPLRFEHPLALFSGSSFQALLKVSHSRTLRFS